MKKILAAVLAGAFGLTAVAQTVVYDYKASFKRVNPIYKIRKVSGAEVVTESYGVTSDSIKGYVILPLCTDCGGAAATSLVMPGTAYLTRSGDKYSAKADLANVLKTSVFAQAAIFGSNAFIIGGATPNGDPHALKDLKSAWMFMSFSTPNPTAADVVDSGLIIPKAAGQDVWYGFMGLDNYLGGSITGAGFGSARVLTQSQAATLGFCGGIPASSSSCRMVQSISGSTIGFFGYDGLCGNTPMWDVCVSDATGMVTSAPISGTWTLKFNNSLSKVAPASQEAEIYKKLKVKAAATDVIDNTMVD